MTSIELLTAPISRDDPCGPDLDALEDDAYTTFMLVTPTRLPDDFYVADHKGDRVPWFLESHYEGIDLAAIIGTGEPLLGRTHDLRLMFLLAKLHLLNKASGEFQAVIEAIAVLLETQWDALHPRGDERVRRNALERLDEPLIVTALNNAPLLRSRRYGVVTWQSYMAAARQGGGQEADTSAVDRVLTDENASDPSSLVSIRSSLDGLSGALQRIVDVCARHFASGPPVLKTLPAAVSAQCAMLRRIGPRGVGAAESLAPGPTPGNRLLRMGLDLLKGPDAAAGPAPPLAPGFDSAEAATRSLAAATAYFADMEPSSPAILLLRRAQTLVGKSFLDAMQALLPEHVSKAHLTIGSASIFNLPLAQFADSGEGDEFPSGRDGDDTSRRRRPVAPLPRVETRAAALSLLDQVSHYYRRAEPSSPIPLLIDRACALAGWDFAQLVSAMLGEDSSQSG